MWAVVLYRAQVRCVGVDGYVENPGNKKWSKSCTWRGKRMRGKGV